MSGTPRGHACAAPHGQAGEDAQPASRGCSATAPSPDRGRLVPPLQTRRLGSGQRAVGSECTKPSGTWAGGRAGRQVADRPTHAAARRPTVVGGDTRQGRRCPARTAPRLHPWPRSQPRRPTHPGARRRGGGAPSAAPVHFQRRRRTPRRAAPRAPVKKTEGKKQ